jgi:hypothetical protein
MVFKDGRRLGYRSRPQFSQSIGFRRYRNALKQTIGITRIKITGIHEENQPANAMNATLPMTVAMVNTLFFNRYNCGYSGRTELGE